jgi:hypothetical protein
VIFYFIDIGGLVVIDFIDMISEEHKKSIEKAMEKATSSDRARIQIGTISRSQCFSWVKDNGCPCTQGYFTLKNTLDL